MRTAVLASGSGTNLQALLDAQKSGALAPANICLVVCNRPGARAIERGRDAGVTTLVIDHKSFASRDDFDTALAAALAEHDVELVVLAGFMRVLGAAFIGQFEGRILNTHPALCPAFAGIRAPQQAIEHGVKVSGCTVHFVDAGVDTGPIIYQAAEPVQPGDTADSLHARIREHEYRLLPLATQRVAAGLVTVDGRTVTVREPEQGAD